jgi:outer membrane lipoprotein carrier protein
VGQLIKVTGKDFSAMNSRNNFTGNYLCFVLCFILLSAVCCLSSSVSAAASSADEEIARIQKAYETVKDISGSFVQKSYIRDLKKTETFKGRFFIKRPMMMKWDYEGEQPQEVFIKNGEITIYQKKEKQAFRSKFDRDTYGQAPIALLSGFGNIREEFYASEKSGKLLLKPKKPMGGILSIEIERSKDEFPIKTFTIIDAYQNMIEMTLRDIKINTGLQDKFFELSLPKGVTVLEHNP